MGPYCNFCNRRCFVYDPRKGSSLLATCRCGQNHDKRILGYCWDEVKHERELQQKTAISMHSEDLENRRGIEPGAEETD